MDNREKLIAILRETEIDNVDGQIIRARMSFVPSVFEKLADHLIANGVTVQRWIPVTERLPENRERVLICTKRKEMWLARHNGGAFWIDCIPLDATHWMPLPEPPKEEA